MRRILLIGFAAVAITGCQEEAQADKLVGKWASVTGASYQFLDDGTCYYSNGLGRGHECKWTRDDDIRVTLRAYVGTQFVESKLVGGGKTIAVSTKGRGGDVFDRQ